MTDKFKDIICNEAHALIESCADTSIDRIQWGRLRQHVRGCISCKRHMRNFHARRIRKEVEIAVDPEQDRCSFLSYGPVVDVEYCHLKKKNLKIYPDGDLIPDEKSIIADHLKICCECRQACPGYNKQPE